MTQIEDVTVTLKEHVAGLPIPLLAVQLTLVVPTGNELPEAGVHVTVGAGVPLAFTVKLTTGEHPPWSILTVMFAGQLMTGGASPVV